MARRILIIVAGGLVSLALCLFLALVLEWPTFFVYVIGLLPVFAAASMGSANQNRGDGQ